MSIKVIAIKKGFYADEVRREGQEFDIESVDEIGSWMDPVGDVSDEVAAAFAEIKSKIKASNRRAKSVQRSQGVDTELEALRAENIRLLRAENERLTKSTAKKPAAKKPAAKKDEPKDDDPLA